MKCLILDDEKTFASILFLTSERNIINFLGIGPVPVSGIIFKLTRTPEEFYEELNKEMPDLLILDNDLGCYMIEGYDILKFILRSRDCSNLKGFISCSLNTPARENAESYFKSWWKNTREA